VWHSDRLRPNDNTSNQSLRGMWLRAVHDQHLVVGLWLASAVVVAVLGYRQAVRSHRAGDEVGGVALTGLLAVLLSPVAWIHHLVWLPLVVGVLAGAARGWPERLRAAGVWLFFVLKLPWWGRSLVAHGVPVAGRLVQDSYGLMALVLLLTVRPRPADHSVTYLAPEVTLRHTGRSPGGGT